MKKLKITITVLLFTVTIANTYAIDLTQWKYRADVTLGEDAAEYCKLQLTPEIYSTARRDLADIRLIDTKQQQKPYLILKPRDICETHRHPITTLNRSNDDDGNSLITLDFSKRVMKNSVKVVTEGKNFRRAVTVEGSNNNVAFFTIVARAYVFSIDNKRDSKKNSRCGCLMATKSSSCPRALKLSPLRTTLNTPPL